ncbi:MAG: Patatin [Solirubrobacterales bacterium]|jgi:patatin-like phospholipase/acyl hydrolase|nr:Patatin [Solirubrobacterales bacterium]
MAPPYRILSIDGGGIKGLIPAVVLDRVEQRVGRPIADCFDLIAGTSSGGILAVALTRAGGDGRPQWAAAELIELYESEGPRIFDRTLLKTLSSLFAIEDEKYPRANLERPLNRYLGDAMLSDALTDLLIPAYETEQRFPFFFKRRRAREDPAHDFAIREVAYATSAAPTYFEPLRLETADDVEHFSLIDGGVYASNPAMCAYAEAQRYNPERAVMLVSLGTGELTRSLPYDELTGWGLREWIWPDTPILNVVFDGMSDAVEYQLTQLLDDGSYFRFQPQLDRARDDLDDASAENLRALKLQATRLLAEPDAAARFERMCELLVA